MKPTDAWKTLKPLVEEKLVQVVDALGEPADLFDLTDEEFGLGLSTAWCSIDAYLGEEIIREGEGTGLCILITAVEKGGRILATYAPYNYTSELWTDSLTELTHRVAQFIPSEMVEYVLQEHSKKEKT